MLSFKNSKIKPYLPFIIGLIVSLVSTFLIIIIFAIAATNFNVSDDVLLVMSIISMVVGVFIGGVFCAKNAKEKGFLVGAINGVIFFIFTTIISIIINPQVPTTISLIKLIVFIISSMIGGITGVNTSKKRRF